MMQPAEARSSGPGSEPPNILLIMADQLVPFLMGAYGHQVVRTPNLTRLAEEGVRFDAAYTSYPLCAPARASMLTGRYAAAIGCFDNASPFGADEPTIAHYLSAAGYDTVLSGKMHFVGPDQLHGFRTRLTTDVYPADFGWTPELDDPGEPAPFDGDSFAAHIYTTPQVGKRQWSMYLAYDEETHFRALEYLYSRRTEQSESEQGHGAERPFFLCVSYHNPHDPFLVTPELWDLYEGEPVDIPDYPANLDETYSTMDRWVNTYHGADRVNLGEPASLENLRRAYYGLVTYIDRKVGELLQTLEATGLSDNTVVIFTSDHGDMLGEKGMVQKRVFYEWSVRIPLIIRFPDRRQRGSVRAGPVSLLDMAPTILDLASVHERLALDGESLLGAEDEGTLAQREIFAEYYGEGVYAPCYMVRSGRYKYIYIHGHDSQLFDLHDDPGEWTNLAGDTCLEAVEAGCKAAILRQFDPEKIARQVQESIRKRRLVHRAMQANDTHWDFSPSFDATRQYVR